MSRPSLTPAMRRALDWLPADGSWRLKPYRSVASALNSLALRRGEWIQSEWGDFGPRKGRCVRWRLTPAGVKEVSEMAARRAA